MPYEDKMSVSYDRLTRTVTVRFRGNETVLPWRYSTEEAGKKAGEDFCRRHGWTG